MIRIVIERTVIQEYMETVNLLTKKTPTAITKPKTYGSGDEPCFVEEYQIADVKKGREVTTKLLQQEITDETLFSLSAVIKAINSL